MKRWLLIAVMLMVCWNVLACESHIEKSIRVPSSLWNNPPDVRSETADEYFKENKYIHWACSPYHEEGLRDCWVTECLDK